MRSDGEGGGESSFKATRVRVRSDGEGSGRAA